jgi:hypothetical protein
MLVQCMKERVLSIPGGVHTMCVAAAELCRVLPWPSLRICSASIESRGNLIAAPLAYDMKLPLVRALSLTSMKRPFLYP